MADALAECIVGLDLGGELALGIDGEGQGDVVALGAVSSVELAKTVEGLDGALVGEDGIAVVVAYLFFCPWCRTSGALTAAWKLQAWKGRGKSKRT